MRPDAGAPHTVVTGLVMRADGTPVADARVTLLDPNVPGASAAIQFRVWDGTTDAAGGFAAHVPRRREYLVEVVVPPDPRDITRAPAIAQRIACLDDHVTVPVVVPAATRITGRVVTASGPAPQITVVARGLGLGSRPPVSVTTPVDRCELALLREVKAGWANRATTAAFLVPGANAPAARGSSTPTAPSTGLSPLSARW